VASDARVTRLRRIADRDRIFFVTTNLGRGVPPLSAQERDLVLDDVALERVAGGFLLFGYVVMPDHLHLLMTPSRLGLQDAMRSIKVRTAWHIGKGRQQHGPLWQSRYFDFILRRAEDFWEKLEYIHQNSVEAKLARSPSEWRWSSHAHYARTEVPPVGIDAIDLPGDREAYLWPAPWC
jgi:putative transposase